MMLRVNLATRPFYNERAVQAVLLAVGVVVLAATAFNMSRLLTLTSHRRAAIARLQAAEAKRNELQGQTRRIRQGLDKQEMAAVSAAAREASAIISQRTFSWTELFNQFESTLPDNARILRVTPAIDDDGTMNVTVVVAARRFEDIETFMERLEATGAFSRLLARRDQTTEEGLVEATLVGRYAPPRGRGY